MAMELQDRNHVLNSSGSSGRRSSSQSMQVYGKSSFIDYIRRDHGEWTTGQTSIHDLCTKQDAGSEMLVIFLPAETELKKHGAHDLLSKRFNIPSSLWGDLALEANGYFACNRARDAQGVLSGLNSQFRFLIKQPKRETIPLAAATLNAGITYVWYKLGFFTSWLSSENSVVLCFDLPLPLKKSLSSSLTNSKNILHLDDPFTFHSLLVQEIVEMYDTALWACRDIVRDLERNRTSSDNPQPDYIGMHEIARHVIHSSEVLAVAIETVTSITEEHKVFPTENPPLSDVASMQSKELGRMFRSQKNVLKALHLRSKALEDRLRNEITLAFNIVTQYDSRIAVRIAEATQVDSTAMKTISVLGLLFLPGTFICAIFSTSFFNFNPGSDTEPQRWVISEKFWVFWLVAIPLTAATVFCWFVWQRIYFSKSFVDRKRS